MGYVSLTETLKSPTNTFLMIKSHLMYTAQSHIKEKLYTWLSVSLQGTSSKKNLLSLYNGTLDNAAILQKKLLEAWLTYSSIRSGMGNLDSSEDAEHWLP